MASLTPVFELLFQGSGVTSTKDDWFDLGSYGPNNNTPIPVGKQLWLGYATFIAEDKQLIFEVRPNKPGLSTGTTANTDLRSFTSVAAGESQDVNMYLDGLITTYAPISSQSTGVEKLWLRIRSGTNTIGAWDFIMFYTLY
jgi:hypothetical protein